MKSQLKFFLLGTLIIFFSPMLGYSLINSLYTNLANEFNTLLEGFITAIRWIGILIFCIGISQIIERKRD